MPRSVTIVTPENVRIQYELAGLGSRGGAAIVDTVLQGLLITGVFSVRILLQHYHKWPGATWANALLGIVSFLIFYGYFTYFEAVWNGQTPGKRYARLRTISEGGHPIDISCSAIRNLVRLIDFLPAIYVVGAIFVILSSRNKRLGDLAAGTIVVKERGQPIANLRVPEFHKAADHPDAERVKNIELVTPDEFQAVRIFIERSPELAQELREELATKIARPLMSRLGIEDVPGMSYSKLLADIHDTCVRDRGMR